jgi:chaperonin cofactor prefoldin
LKIGTFTVSTKQQNKLNVKEESSNIAPENRFSKAVGTIFFKNKNKKYSKLGNDVAKFK